MEERKIKATVSVGNEKAKSVLVGLSGGIDSLVAAYLLRIQKRQIYAAIVASTPENFQDEGDTYFACHQTDARISAVKKFCEHLQIPLAILRSRDEFSEDVMEGWVGSRATGRTHRACYDCHHLRIQTLYRHMKEIGCETFATGHYAKLSRNAPGSPVSVHSSSDMDADQSGLLMGLPAEVLNAMELPLSELQRKEIIRIGENFELHPPARVLKWGECLSLGPSLKKWLESRIPEVYRGQGNMMSLTTGSKTGTHSGLYNYEFGKVWQEAKNPNEKDKLEIIVQTNWTTKDMWTSTPSYFNDKSVILTRCNWGEGMDFSAPLQGFLLVADVYKEVLVQPRTLGAAWIQLLEGEESFVLGKELVVYRRKGKNAKVIVCGTIQKLGKQVPSSKISIGKDNRRTGGETIEIDRDFNF